MGEPNLQRLQEILEMYYTPAIEESKMEAAVWAFPYTKEDTMTEELPKVKIEVGEGTIITVDDVWDGANVIQYAGLDYVYSWTSNGERWFVRDDEIYPFQGQEELFDPSLFEDKHQIRKEQPLYRGLFKYFPDALRAVANCSYVGNEQHHPGTPMHWDKDKSQDELDALLRHAMDAGKIDDDGILHSTKVAWRALANLQRELEGSSIYQEGF